MNEIGEVLFDPSSIESRVGELAGRISEDYGGKNLVLVGILNGAAVFLADLMRRLTVIAAVEFVRSRSYGGASVSSGEITVDLDLQEDLGGQDILLVDTIVDTGRTLSTLRRRFAGRGPSSLRTAVLLDKRCRRTHEVTLDYRGFVVPDRFLVGYGIDFDGKYRTLPYLAALRLEEEREI